MVAGLFELSALNQRQSAVGAILSLNTKPASETFEFRKLHSFKTMP
jgi:hypothetical protein